MARRKGYGSIQLLILCSVFTHGYGQDIHEKSVYLLRNNGVDAAIAYVQENSSKSLYDFGRELSFLGKTEEALEWYASLTKKFNDPKYFYGKAWTQMGC